MEFPYPYPAPNRTIPLIIILAVVGFAVWLYYKGKNAGKTDIPDVAYPHGKDAIPVNFNPNVLADELYNVMNDFLVLSTTKEAAWFKLYALPTDDLLVSVYNTFNKKYGAKGKGSLTKWIDDEVYYNWNASVKAKLVARLRSLNLK